ncbi:MAG TPA: SIMPL domain-containing protein [Mycobacteriales bacterium]|nr:SIMPL domain-containing protein [Mycobacteriales bacterium]
MSSHRMTKVAAATALAAGGLILSTAPPAGAAPAPADTVSVSGHGSVKGTPDTLIADMDAHARAANASDALSAASQVATNVVDALEANGVDASDIQTSGVSVGATYGKAGTVTGYRADESITARMHPLSTAQTALGAASQAGGNGLDINSTDLTISNRAHYLAEARAHAFANAKAAAEQYAELAGRQLGRVISITATSSSGGVVRYPVPVEATGSAAGGAGSAVPINPGTQTIGASVRVVWALK